MYILRKIKRNKTNFIINAIALSIAISCVIMVVIFAKQELSYDKFNTKAEQIYRVTTSFTTQKGGIHPARVSGNWTANLVQKYPEIEKQVRIMPYRNAVVTIDDKVFYSEKAFSTDSTFFDIFDFKILSGNKQTAFTQPHQVFVSQSIAQKYFGTTNVIGKTISLMHQLESKAEEYNIVGVMADFPKNSHFHIDILTSQESYKNRTEWAYTYFLTKPNSNMEKLAKSIHAEWEKDDAERGKLRRIYFQKLTDIHLHSHKAREIENNGNLRSVILLLTGGFMVLLIAFINFFNLSRVQLITEIKNINIRIVNGATKLNIIIEKIKDALPLAFIVAVLSLMFVYQTNSLFDIGVNNYYKTIGLILVLAFVLIIFVAVSILFFVKLSAQKKQISHKLHSYKIPLIMQLCLSVIAIVGTIVLHRQIELINTLHPNAKNTNMLIIPKNTQDVTNRYDVLKSELLKLAEVKEVSSVMEMPGGNMVDFFKYELEGVDDSKDNTIKILTCDTNFFTIINVKPIVGTAKLKHPTELNWEKKAIDLGIAKMTKNADVEKIKELERAVGNYTDSYIINKSAVKIMGFKNPEEAIGKQMRLIFNLADMFPKGKIVGVVPDFHYTNLFDKEEPMVVVAKKMFSRCFLIKISNKNNSLKKIADVWSKVNPNYPFRYEFINDRYKTVYRAEYKQSKVLSAFALISIIISAMGIFAIVSFSIQQRIKEIGIRKINGATIVEILKMLNKNFVKWVVLAFVIAVPIAYYTMNLWLQNFAYKTTLSWWIFALSGVFVLAISTLTVSWKSWQAATCNPVDALRYE